MKRRAFITLLGSAAAWPLAARAQKKLMRRVGILMNRRADNAEGRDEVKAFQQALEKLGWSDGHNVRIDVRWAILDLDHMRCACPDRGRGRPSQQTC